MLSQDRCSRRLSTCIGFSDSRRNLIELIHEFESGESDAGSN